MKVKWIRVVLFFVVLVSASYGCSPMNTQLQNSTYSRSVSAVQAAALVDAAALSTCNNIALGKATNASATWAGHPSSMAVDGDLTNMWNAGTYPTQWIEINLGSEFSVDEIRLYVEQYPAGNTTHEIWVADSSKSYTLLETISGFTEEGQLLDRVYSPSLTSVQWIKVITTASLSWVAWQEIQVCQTPVPTSTPTNTPVPGPCDNVALGAASDASATWAGHPSSMAVDGDLTNMWNAGTYVPQWIEVNLGSLYSIDEIRLYVEQFPAGNTTNEVWVADSSKVYTLLKTISGFTEEGQLLSVVSSPPISIQWIKVITTSSPSWVAWKEIQACKTPSTPTTTATSTGTATSTSTSTETSTPTSTATGTPTGPATNTPTETATGTATSVSTDTPTPTPTGGPTSTPTNTPTSEPTFTPTPTRTPTATPIMNTPGKITGGGNLGEKATFGFTVNYAQGDSAPKGNLTFIDHGLNLRLKSTSLSMLVISGDYAWFTGVATVNDTQEVEFKVEIKDLSQGGSMDWFKITIPALNYELGGSMTGGNITIHK